MRPAPRRLTFQLVSLFDLLMIVIFAQYMDVQQDVRTQTEESQAAIARSQAEVERVRRQLELDNATFRKEVRAREVQLQEELRQSRADIVRVGELVAAMFDLPEAFLNQMLKSRSPAEAARLRATLKVMTAQHGGEVVRQILTLAELQKRCDVWDVQIDDQNVVTFIAGKTNSRFRASNGPQFAAELMKAYKTLPQPKSMVIILLSWSDADLRSRNAAITGLELAIEKLRLDTDRRTRFESAVLGFIPVSASPR